MGDMLNEVDRAIDVETIIMKRCVDACIEVIRPFMVMNMDGPDPLPTDHAGFFDLAAAVYTHARQRLTSVSGDRLIQEYVDEQRDANAQRAAEVERHKALQLSKTGAI